VPMLLVPSVANVGACEGAGESGRWRRGHGSVGAAAGDAAGQGARGGRNGRDARCPNFSTGKMPVSVGRQDGGSPYGRDKRGRSRWGVAGLGCHVRAPVPTSPTADQRAGSRCQCRQSSTGHLAPIGHLQNFRC